jgi:hypothetical protein
LEGQEFHRTVDDARIAFEANEDTQLTAYFKLGKDQSARNVTYVQIPESYTWISGNRVWRKRKRRLCIGRIYGVSPTAGELFYLRLLLFTVAGTSSFGDLRTVNGDVYSTYRDACAARGLLDDDNERYWTLTEAQREVRSCVRLRELFFYVIQYCTPQCPDSPRLAYNHYISSSYLRFMTASASISFWLVYAATTARLGARWLVRLLGNMRQILPVALRAGPSGSRAACIIHRELESLGRRCVAIQRATKYECASDDEGTVCTTSTWSILSRARSL